MLDGGSQRMSFQLELASVIQLHEQLHVQSGLQGTERWAVYCVHAGDLCLHARVGVVPDVRESDVRAQLRDRELPGHHDLHPGPVSFHASHHLV